MKKILTLFILTVMTCTSFFGIEAAPASAATAKAVAPVTSSLASGTYSSSKSVALKTATTGATIYFTTNGSTPTTKSKKYTNPVTISVTTTLKAIAVKKGLANSPVVTFSYKIDSRIIENVTSSVASGTYTSSRSVVLQTLATGATIYYTTDSSNPTTISKKYTKAIVVSSTTVVKAIAVKGAFASKISTFSYTIKLPKVNLKGNVVMRGSSALYPLVQLAVDPFMNKYGDLLQGTIDCGAGEGSGAGLDALNSGTGGCNVGNSDVTLEQAGKAYTGFVDNKVATVAVAVVVAPDVAAKFKNGNSYNAIKASELKKIYDGQITNWKDIHGANGYDKSIAVCYRKKGSGTRTLFQAFGIPGTTFDETKAPFNGASFIYTNASQDLAAKILSQNGSIGYETVPYCGALTKLPVIFDLDANGNILSNPPTTGITCTYTNVNNGTYKIWGYEHMYTKGTPGSDSASKAFIDYITSADFQSIILSNGYGLVSNLSDAAKVGH